MSAQGPLERPGDGLLSTDFRGAIRTNRRYTRILCLLLILLGAAIGYVGGWGFEIMAGQPDAYDTHAPGQFPAPSLLSSAWGLRGAVFMLLFGAIWTLVAIFFGDRMVVALAGATDASADGDAMLHNVVEEMAIASGLPKPRVVIVETPALNAFATGRSPEKATLGVTRGLIEKLDRSELQGVIGHEMAHIANNDILYATAVGVIVGMIVLTADLARVLARGMVYSGRHSRRRSGGRGGGGTVILALIVFVVFSVLAPLAAKMVQMAISRQREYLADATSVLFTRNPRGLIDALGKIEQSGERYEGASRAIQHLFIANPLRNFPETAGALFSTHPALSLRIRRLRGLK